MFIIFYIIVYHIIYFIFMFFFEIYIDIIKIFSMVYSFNLKNWRRCFVFFYPHVLVCMLRSKNMKRLTLFQIKLYYLFLLMEYKLYYETVRKKKQPITSYFIRIIPAY
ncbi:unknown [Rickettsia conorii str. Malish 7]|uniref:Uncharacterized protein n=1 Tax=Rickettsia conorii (strain ATCC VR-613 / Malish 7) TaxID=272944 RepID=Q92GZ6_RICCN|nr:unknown [Rickettsia conorii str. Malish 7]